MFAELGSMRDSLSNTLVKDTTYTMTLPPIEDAYYCDNCQFLAYENRISLDREIMQASGMQVSWVRSSLELGRGFRGVRDVCRPMMAQYAET
jgi:hypothetical protein